MQFLDKLNQATNNKYNFLRVSNLNLDIGSNSLSVVCLLPPDLDDEKFTDEDKKTVEEFCRQEIPEQFSLKIAFIKNKLNKEVILKQVINFMSNKHKTLSNQYDAGMTDIEILDGNKIIVNLYMSSAVIDYCEKSGIKDNLAKYIYSQNCAEKVTVKLNVSKEVDSEQLLIDRENVRYVDMGEIDIIGDYHYYIGKDILKKPRYIDKYKKEMEGICVCGTIKELKTFNVLDKNSPDKRLKKVLYKFTIDDTTGSMDCIYFAKPRKPKKHEENKEFVTCLDGLKEGDDVVVFGNYRMSDYSGKNELNVLKLALCKINYQGLDERRESIKRANKVKVFQKPQEYKEEIKDNLFDMLGHCDYIMNNKFIVFDLETTGTSISGDEIIEIGAVKLVEGKIIEYYNTLVDPDRHIPEGASEVNHIYDEDVKNAPYIEDVMPFFMDYCKGYILIAHNGAGFDFRFIEKYCNKFGLKFENKLVDSLTEARKILKKQRSHSLASLCNYYNIVNKNAHRAYEDAEATAKVFVKLMDEFYRKDKE